MIKRSFDLLFSLCGLIVFLPLFAILGLLIKITSKGPILFKQIRIGKNQRPFKIFKFRTMILNAEKKGILITIGAKDTRITKIGYFLRKLKLDELPQLFNVLIGDMSLVGPRPEVPKYVDLYNEEQKKVLQVRPGITDLASIKYRNENELLAQYANPEKTYIEEIMPKKLELNINYINNQSILLDISIIMKTILKVIF